MENINIEKIAQKLGLKESQVSQVLDLTAEGNTIPFDLITSEAEFKKILHTVIRETDQRIPEVKKLLESIFEEKTDLSQIFLSKTAFNIISNRYFSSWHTLLEKGVELKLFKFKKNLFCVAMLTITDFEDDFFVFENLGHCW